MLKNKVSERAEVYIIAELGINHDGSLKLAKELIDSAAASGAHAIKYQYRNLLNAYSEESKEIGDELLKSEINKNYIAPEDILTLHGYAKSKGLDSGISFFDLEDIKDFSMSLPEFDFFKIPSAELMNVELINFLLATEKQVYISTGCHTESEIEFVFNSLQVDNWLPLHCVSNYPTMSQNARLGYITHLKNKWKKEVGYSSHDDSWEVCLLAMQLGAVVIERHITFDRCGDGLDHSSSSTPDEFEKISFFSSRIHGLMKGDSPRIVNQGELLNRQNLGRSYYANVDLKEGHKINFKDLSYRSPCVGLNKSNIEKFVDKKLLKPVKKGAVLSESLFKPKEKLSDDVIEFATRSKLALPVRLHDLNMVESSFPIGSYEFHLSFEEVKSNINTSLFNSDNNYSVHLPDYITPTLLMDPFSVDAGQKKESLLVLDQTVDFTKKLQDLTGKDVPIVGSFSLVHGTKESFFYEYSKLLDKYKAGGVHIMPQWLPPIAWYFGGSIKLEIMNGKADIDYIKNFKIPICMDFCHLIMCKNYGDFSAKEAVSSLSQNIKHIHIADAVGIDGEGISFGKGEPENIKLIKDAFNYDCLKVIEVWQGHLDEGAGFKKALNDLKRIYGG